MKNEQTAGDGIDRRKLLKGAAALGVGVAAWSAPNIKTLGTTPAGAAHTGTTSVTSLLSDCNSLNANCGSPNCVVGEWGSNANPALGQINVTNFPTPVTAVIVTVNGCATTGGTGSVTSAPAGYNCMVEEIYVSNQGNSPMNFALVGTTTGADPVLFGGVLQSMGNCPYFICATVSCTTI